MQLQAVSTVEIEQHIRFLMAERKISESSIVKMIDVLNAAYVWAVLRGDLEKLDDVQGGLHIFRKTFAMQMYEKGARVEEIAAYIGDLESTTRKYYD